MTPPVQKTVGIIGAAIAGPTLALHLLTHPVLRTRFRPVLFDQSPPPASGPASPEHHQRAGASVCLFPNGLHPLHSLGLEKALKTHGHECDDMSLWSSSSSASDLTHMKTAKNTFWSHDLQAGAMYFERAGLQALLVDRVRELGGEVRWSKKAVRYENAGPEGGVKGTRVSFSDGTQTDVDLLVGADGGYSPVRRHILTLRDSTTAENRWPPDFMGMTGIYGISSAKKLPASHVPSRPFTESQCIFLPQGFLATGPCPDDMFRWDLILPESTPPESGSTTQELPSTRNDPEEVWQAAVVPGPYPLSATAAILRSHLSLQHPFAGTFETLLTTSDRIIHTPLRQRVWKEDEIQWSGNGSPVILVGDAARLMLPTSGQGTGFAIEDATVLANMLLKHSPAKDGFRSALEEYARLRQPRSSKMAKTASLAGAVGLGATWYSKLLRYGTAKLTFGVDKARKGKDPWPMDGRFDIEES